MKELLKNILKGKVVIMGVGNLLRGDDGLGCMIVDRLKGNVRALCLDAGSTPESYVGKIAKDNADTVLIIDAAYLDRSPGDYEILEKNNLRGSGLSTHDISPGVFFEYLLQETHADVYMLAVQPEKVGFGEEMSEKIKKAISEISAILMDILSLDK
ncbi:MAG: hydrogenase maturation protease [Candidatus Aureabacteria bacterium]|nr:hydrogenase maturation protease [Candidatus Auribacterota bacterium]